MTTIDADLRAWAKEHYLTQVAIELLISAGLTESHPCAWIEPSTSGHRVNHTKLAAEAAGWSGPNRAVARLAIALLGGAPAHIDDVLPDLPDELVTLAFEAWEYLENHRKTTNRAHDTTTGRILIARAIARSYSRSVEAFTDILKQHQKGSVDCHGIEAALAKTSDDITRDNPDIPDVDTFTTMALSEAAAGQLNQGNRDLGFTASSFPQWDRGITEHLAEQFANPNSTASMCATLRTEWLIIPLNVADIVANQWAAPNRPDNALEPFPRVGNGTGPSTKNLDARYQEAYNSYADAFSDAVRANADGIVHDPVKIYVTAETAANQLQRDPNAYHYNPEIIGGHRFTPDMLGTFFWEQAHQQLAPPRL